VDYFRFFCVCYYARELRDTCNPRR